MWIVRLALRRPYTFVVMSVLIGVLGLLSIFQMPVDIFPSIDIPVVAVVWQYSGLAPEEMERRKRLVARLRCRMASPVTESDREIWQELAAGLEKERLTFRS